MLDAFLGHYAYWGAIVLFAVGLYTVTASANLVKKVMGLSIFQSAVFVLYISIGSVEGGTAPIVDSGHAAYANPLPHVLILTAIVVGVATAALALALVVRIHAACDSVEEDVVERALQATGRVEAWMDADGRAHRCLSSGGRRPVMASGRARLPDPGRHAWRPLSSVRAAWIPAFAGTTKDGAVGRLSKDRNP